ncbi:DUF4019 domain-containing protein [Neorhizobium sp. T25_27]|jgi:hypothetical protein|uniref:DUF4019 domain-containing protein n=1 Tax=Neorhizobium sp. T25_27 TaxID=2093831 RepID=UPI000CFA174C|nr:DUF4019 domain-containing protein [Neorhizobium sp. T25_27]
MVIPPANNHPQGLVDGRININNLLGFGFGVFFVTVILVFAVGFPNPTQFQYYVFIVVLSLAAAGVGAILPGALGIEWGGAIAGVPVVKAGGALGLFVVVLAFSPVLQTAAVRLVEPTVPVEPVALTYLQATDTGDMQTAWNLMDEEAKGLVVPNVQDWEVTYRNFRVPLGLLESRLLVGTTGMNSPTGVPIGLYRGLTYKSKFSADEGQCRAEVVVLRATQDLQWKVFSHQISPTRMPC